MQRLMGNSGLQQQPFLFQFAERLRQALLVAAFYIAQQRIKAQRPRYRQPEYLRLPLARQRFQQLLRRAFIVIHYMVIGSHFFQTSCCANLRAAILC